VKQERTNSVHRRQNNVTEIDEEQESIVVENNKTKPRDVFKNFDKKIINNINIKIHSEESTQMKENNRLSTLNIKQEMSENDYAYGRSDEKTISTNVKSHTDITVDELQSGYQRTDNLNIQNTKMAPIPVYPLLPQRVL
jgi:predicted transcriptional regulator